MTPVLDQNFQDLVGQIFVRHLWGLVLQLPKSLSYQEGRVLGSQDEGGWQPSLIAPRLPAWLAFLRRNHTNYTKNKTLFQNLKSQSYNKKIVDGQLKRCTGPVMGLWASIGCCLKIENNKNYVLVDV